MSKRQAKKQHGLLLRMKRLKKRLAQAGIEPHELPTIVYSRSEVGEVFGKVPEYGCAVSILGFRGVAL